MVVIACTPCLASTLGPTALSVATFVGLNNTDKKKNKKKNKKKKKTKQNKQKIKNNNIIIYFLLKSLCNVEWMLYKNLI